MHEYPNEYPGVKMRFVMNIYTQNPCLLINSLSYHFQAEAAAAAAAAAAQNSTENASNVAINNQQQSLPPNNVSSQPGAGVQQNSQPIRPISSPNSSSSGSRSMSPAVGE